jgi:hypothetical protein
MADVNLIVNFDECILYIAKTTTTATKKEKENKKQYVHCSHIEVVF